MTIKLNYILLFLLSFAIITLTSSCSEEEKQQYVRPVKAITLGNKKDTISRQLPGKVIPTNEVDLAFQVPGIINELPVQEGDLVKQGDLIARLDQRKYLDAVNESKAKYLQTKADYARVAQLVEKNYVSRSDFDKKKYEFKVAEANYSKAKNDLKDTYIYAPFDGIIAKRFVENFENVKAKQPVVNMHDYKTIDISFSVPENLIIRSDEGSEARFNVRFESAPEKIYPAKLKKFESKADEETQTYKVVIILPSPKNLTVLPGMTATVEVELPDYTTAQGEYYELPATAVFADTDKQAFVWVVNQNSMQVKKTPVKISRLSSDKIRVLNGVKSGDIVVTAGVHNLQDGEKVRLLEKQKWEK